MDSVLSELETKISQLIAVVDQLRSENRLLRQQIVTKADETKRLSKKIEATTVRLHALLEQLPENEK